MITCPDCKSPNLDETQFCAICGGELTGQRLDARARIMFFATPPILVLIGMAFGLDFRGSASEDMGTGLGLFLAMIYMFAGGGYWFLTVLFKRPLIAVSPWLAGVYGVLAFVGAWLLSYPLSAMVKAESMNRLPVGSEERFQFGLIFACYLPMILGGLLSLNHRDWAAIHRQIPSRFARTGATAILFGSLALFVVLSLVLPVWERNLVGARLFADLGRFRQTLEYLDRSLAAKPDFAPALALKGTLMLAIPNEKNAGEAVRLLREALKSDPRNPRYHFTLSIAEEQAGNRDGAMENASMAVFLNPTDPMLLAHHGDLLLAAKRPAEAIEVYRRVLRIRPDDPRVLNNLAFTLIELNKELPAALDLAKESVNQLPGRVFNLDTLAWAYYKNGQLNEAFETIREVRASASGAAEIEFHYAVIASELGLLQRPEAVFSALLAHPDVRADQKLREQVLVALAGAPLLTSGTAILQGKNVGLGSGSTATGSEAAPAEASPTGVIETTATGTRILIEGIPVLVREEASATVGTASPTVSDAASQTWGQ